MPWLEAPTAGFQARHCPCPVPDYSLQRQLKRICKKAGIKFPHRGGFHCFRRRVATDVSEIEPSDINTSNFMRWATPRGLSMLARYKQTPVEETDRAILEKHPYVNVWEEVCPFITQHNSDYREHSSLYCNEIYCATTKEKGLAKASPS